MKLLGKTLLLLLLVGVGVVGLTRLITHTIKKNTSPREWEIHTTGIGLALASWQRLELAKVYPAPKLYILGSSISMKTKIDTQNFKNFNFGFYAASPSLIDWYSREIVRQAPSTPNIIALEFLPHFHTLAADKSMLDSTALRKAALLNSANMAWLAHASWKESSTVLLDWLRGVSAPQINVNILNKHFYPKTAASVNDLQFADFERQNRYYDLTELRPSPKSLQTYIETVKRLSSATSCLVLFTPPENSELWRRSEQGERHLQVMLGSIKAATGYQVFSFQEKYPALLFRDATHLNFSDGQQRFNQDLASLVAQECSKSLK